MFPLRHAKGGSNDLDSMRTVTFNSTWQNRVSSRDSGSFKTDGMRDTSLEGGKCTHKRFHAVHGLPESRVRPFHSRQDRSMTNDVRHSSAFKSLTRRLKTVN